MNAKKTWRCEGHSHAAGCHPASMFEFAIVEDVGAITSMPKLVDGFLHVLSEYWRRDVEEIPWWCGAHLSTYGYVSADCHWAISATGCRIIGWICRCNHWGAFGQVGGSNLILWCMFGMFMLESVLKECGWILQEGNVREWLCPQVLIWFGHKWLLHTKFTYTKLAAIISLSCQMYTGNHRKAC